MKLNTSIAFAAALAVLSFAPSAAFAEDAAAPAAAVSLTSGKMIFSAKGARVGAIYRVNAAGAPQVIIDGRLVTVPLASVSESEGKIVTTYTRAELVRLK